MARNIIAAFVGATLAFTFWGWIEGPVRERHVRL